MIKSMIRVMLGVALAVQLTGCFYRDRDDRWHHDHDRIDHPDHHDDAGIDVHVHS